MGLCGSNLPHFTSDCDWACKNRPCEHKKLLILPCLLYHNLITVYTTAAKPSSLLQNLMGFLLQLTEMDSAFRMKDICQNITQCNLRSHGRFS